MPGLPSELDNRCQQTLQRCKEFDSHRALRAVFITEELYPFRGDLPEAGNKGERVAACLDYLLEQRSTAGRPVLAAFLATLSGRYAQGNALRDELAMLARDVERALVLASSSPAATPEPAAGAVPDRAGASGRGADVRGDGNIVVTGDVQGGISIVQGGSQPTGRAPAPPVGTEDAAAPSPSTVRDLLLAAFTAKDLRRLFVFTENPELRPLTQEFGPNDGLVDMVERTIEYCGTRGLLPALLQEVARERPRVYGQYFGDG